MQVLVRLETVNRDTKVKGWGNELIMDVRAKRLLDPDKKKQLIHCRRWQLNSA